MRPIKFRGRYVKDYVGNEYIAEGEMIFGGFVMLDGKPHIIPHDLALEVEPDSVAQLVGYDANGKEVYEGDAVLRYDSEEEFIEAPENGVLRKVILYTQVNPDLEDYYCLVKEADQ